jgi:hypothetical protein
MSGAKGSTRRGRFITSGVAALSVAGLIGLAGCSSASPDTSRGSANEDDVTTAVTASPTRATITSQGDFKVNLPLEYAELSGVAFAGDQFLVVDDKTPDGDVGQAVLTLPETGVASGVALTPDTALPDRKIQKLEAITTTPDGQHVIATTAYHKFKQPDDKSTYNVTLTWPVGNPQDVTILGKSEVKPKTSLALRQGLLDALGNPNYMRIEGLAATENELLFGVRQTGADSDTGQYGVTIVAVPYANLGGLAVEPEKAKVVYQMDEATRKLAPLDKIGLSDIWRDPATGSLTILTSVEDPNSQPVLAGFIWSINPDQYASGTATLLNGSDGTPLEFQNKTEGITRMPSGNFLVVSDNDEYDNIGPGKGLSQYYEVSVS